MKKHSGIIVLTATAALAVVVVLSTALAQTRPAVAPPPAARVAVCDVGAVFNGYERRAELNKQLETRRTAANQEDEKRQGEIARLEKAIKLLKPGSEQHETQLTKLAKLSISRKAWREFEERKFLSEHRRMMEQIYAQILQAVADTARARRYDLILYRESIEIASQSTSELYKKIAQRKCLYANPAIDLTQSVLDRLNAAYRAGQR